MSQSSLGFGPSGCNACCCGASVEWYGLSIKTPSISRQQLSAETISGMFRESLPGPTCSVSPNIRIKTYLNRQCAVQAASKGNCPHSKAWRNKLIGHASSMMCFATPWAIGEEHDAAGPNVAALRDMRRRRRQTLHKGNYLWRSVASVEKACRTVMSVEQLESGDATTR